MSLNAVVYDIEIVKAVPTRGVENTPGIEYCKGWGDKKNMGISVLGAYDFVDERYRVICEDNKEEWLDLINDRDLIVSFNGIKFDNEVVKHVWGYEVPLEKNYDILVEMWRAKGFNPDAFVNETHGGHGLDVTCKANGLQSKTGHGAFAPIEWQRGNIGHVIDYCLQDVKLTKELFEAIMEYGWIDDPKSHGARIIMRPPIALTNEA